MAAAAAALRATAAAAAAAAAAAGLMEFDGGGGGMPDDCRLFVLDVISGEAVEDETGEKGNGEDAGDLPPDAATFL